MKITAYQISVIFFAITSTLVIASITLSAIEGHRWYYSVGSLIAAAVTASLSAPFCLAAKSRSQGNSQLLNLQLVFSGLGFGLVCLILIGIFQ